MKYLYIAICFIAISAVLAACDSKPEPKPVETIEVRVVPPTPEEIKAFEAAELEEEENNQEVAEIE